MQAVKAGRRSADVGEGSEGGLGGKGQFKWVNFVFLVVTPLASAILLPIYVAANGFAWGDLVAFLVMYFATGLAITAGYHRFYSHRAYDCSRGAQLLFLVFGAAAFQNSAFAWVSDHRYHHRHVDKEGDPYNIRKGFLWAHIGWIFFGDSEERSFANIRDLEKDRLVLWQKRWYVPIAVLATVLPSLLIGWLFDRPGGGLLWGGLVRLVFTHHCTFLINSAAHYFGSRPYSLANSARDSWWLAFLSYGEGYHNFHHAFPSDYRNGVAWYHWDPTKWLIAGMRRLGMASSLRVTPRATLEQARRSVRQAGGRPAGRAAAGLETLGASGATAS